MLAYVLQVYDYKHRGSFLVFNPPVSENIYSVGLIITPCRSLLIGTIRPHITQSLFYSLKKISTELNGTQHEPKLYLIG